MDRGSGFLQIPTQRISPAQECWTCAIVESVSGHSTVDRAPAYVVEAANEDAVVLSGPELAGLVVVPRRCIKGLESLPPLPRAQVLAAVRCATLLVRQGNRGASSRIVALTDPSTREGHVSFQVIPNGSDDPTRPVPASPFRVPRRSIAVAKAEALR